MKSYVQDTNSFLKKIANLPPLPDDLVLCTIDVVGPYPNISHQEGLIASRRAVDSRKNKTIWTYSLIELGECVLKYNIFEHDKSVFKQLRGTAIGTKMVLPDAIIFMDSLEKDILSKNLLKPLVWCCYIDNILMWWYLDVRTWGWRALKVLKTLNCYHPAIKFIAEYSRANANVLDVTVMRKGNQLVTDLYIKPTGTHQYFHASSCHVSHCKK